MLRKLGVVGKLVEFFGPGVAALPVADRATIANMAPEYGATCGIFPIDDETLRYLRFSGRAPEQVALVEAYAREQGLFHDATTKEAAYTDVADLDLALGRAERGRAEAPAGSGRPLSDEEVVRGGAARPDQAEEEGGRLRVAPGQGEASQSTNVGYAPAAPAAPEIKHGSVVIAAITSCTNTSNPW